MHTPSVVAILGMGVWGTALGKIVQDNHHNVYAWSHRGDMPLVSVVQDAQIIVSAVSMQGVVPTAQKLRSLNLPVDKIIVTATKGLDPETKRTPSQLWQSILPHNSVVVLSGPNLSKEIDQGLPAATVLASSNLAAAQQVQKMLASDTFRAYVNQDPLGTELGGTLKNVMAIASGVCDGMNLGTNAKAALLTRALPEMIRIGTHLGASGATFFGLSGLGDLIATCDSPLSRNYQVGYRLAQGQTLEEILADLEGTAEGVNTTKVVVKIADSAAIAVPIAQQVNKLLQGEITPQSAIKALMERNLKPEFDDLNF
ncbi:NAD(P)H-dependent glycerol-3-phosphate dehydrogenase [Pleurocapsa sp. CCALA 161]|uniref:NAD(P)H-dependent glycerol-3-phosphate dehydrogenase n=1 Tax=Pleurocapsa sp. CCALA 161 TaxID=2107688 RepID=UPI000D06B1DB|nr:NAD(P)H-dependent glycerol-3-phosphate dehydrogenase [Pleurocapsa sp. CCALA 161]PSB08406.1 NAD(P)H-dependent glycerol-3-phosphate dehydrogenase [Pleurocapsa sp. CCALA 161]